MNDNREKVTRGSGNVFADLGLPDADEELVKSRLVILIGQKMEEQNLTQTAAAKRLGISQPDVSKLLGGRLGIFSLERLMAFVRALGNDIEIDVKPVSRTRNENRHGRILMKT